MAHLGKDLSGYEAQEGFDVLPPGEYDVRIVDSEIKEGAKGPYINWTFEVIGRPGRIWDTMSLNNEVSLRRLKTLATCAGHRNPNYIQDTDELHGLQVRVKLKIEKDDSGQYPDKNRISAFLPKASGSAAPLAPAMPAGTPPATAPAPNPAPAANRPRMPWEKDSKAA